MPHRRLSSILNRVMKLFTHAFLFAAASSLVAAGKLTSSSTGKTYTVGNVSYFVPPHSVSKFILSSGSASTFSTLSQDACGELVGISVFPTDHPHFGVEAFEGTIAEWSKVDDVFNSDVFLDGKLFLSITSVLGR